MFTPETMRLLGSTKKDVDSDKNNKGLSEDDKKEGLFKRLKNIENPQKNLIGDNENIYYTPRSKFDDKDDKYKKSNKATK